MTSLFMGLETGKKAIMTNQTALAVAGHNVSNASTTGYTRQIANLSATKPFSPPGVGQIGTGVEVNSIKRIRDAYLDAQYRQENTTTGYWESVQSALDQVELILNEPSDDSLSSALDKFWAAWEDLCVDPQSSSTRAVVAQSGATLADTFNQMYNQLEDLYRDLNYDIQVKISEINSIGEQIVALNKQIMAVTNSGQEANDLCDSRDLLLDQLSRMVNIDITTADNGMISVAIGGRSFVEGKTYNPLATKENEMGISTVIWKDTQVPVQLKGGELYGSQVARDEMVAGLITDLNRLAKTIVLSVNAVHEKGYSLVNTGSLPDGTSFFALPEGVSPDSVTEWAQFIKVNEDILANPQKIAAASAPIYDSSGKEANVGDSSNAVALAALKDNLNSSQISFVETNSFSLPAADSDVSFKLIYGGKSYTISVTVQSSWTSPWQDLQTELQKQIDVQIGTGRITVELSNPSASETEDVSLKFTALNDQLTGLVDFINPNENYSASQVKKISVETEYFSLPANDFSFKVNYGGKSYTIEITAAEFTTWEELQTAIQSRIDAKIGAGKIKVELSDPAASATDKVSLKFTAGEESFAGIEDFMDNAERDYYVMQIRNATFSDFWSALVAEVGVQSQAATNVLENQEELINELDEKRQSVSGVSLDEEAINLIQFQQSYNAAARFVTVIDEMLDKLINGTGVVGR